MSKANKICDIYYYFLNIFFQGKAVSSILSDDDTGMKFIQYNVDYLNQSTVGSIMDTLFHVKERRNLYFLVMSNGDATKYIVKQVSKSWSLLISYDEKTLMVCTPVLSS